MFAKIKSYRYLLLAVLVFCLPLSALAAPGDLDLTFDTDGKVTKAVSADSDSANAVAFSGVNIVVAGFSVVSAFNQDFAVLRYKPDGSTADSARARVILTDGNGEKRIAITSSFGYFRFDEVKAGETDIFEIRHKRYQFAPQILTINEFVEDLNFVADSSAFREH